MVEGRDPWGAATVEWSIPSPPPEYNYAVIPTITSRYPLWDVKSPELTADVPHTPEGEKRTDVRVGGKETTASFKAPSDTHMASEAAHPSATELGIAMPTPTIKPLLASIGLTVMFLGLILKHNANQSLWLPILLGGVAFFVASLYAWLLSPLEPEHH